MSQDQNYGAVSQLVSTRVCDWIFENIFNEQVFNSKSKQEQVSLFASAFERLAESLVLLDAAHEGCNAEIFSMTKEALISRKELTPSLVGYTGDFDTYWGWLLSSKQKPKSERIIEYEAYSFLRVCTRYGNDIDKSAYFTCVSQARNLFNHILTARAGKPNMISSWGLGLTFYLQARAIDSSCELKAKAITGLLIKAQELMTHVVFRLKLVKEDGMDRYVRQPHYYLGCTNAAMKSVDESLFWLTKAKVKGAIPRTSAQIYHDFKCIADKDSALAEIITESLQYSKERLAFLQDRKRYLAKLMGTNMLEMSLTASQLGVHEGQLSASVVMSDSLIMNALSTSTLNFLTNGQFHINVNLKQFLEPVKTTQHVEAENRLKTRLKLYGLEARRDIPGDGNCQMYSLSHQLTDSIKHAKFIRRSVVAWLRRNADLQLPNGALLRHFAYDKEWDAYCNEMARDGVWGDHLTLIAAAEVFHARIVIVSSVPGDSFIVEINPIGTQGEGEVPIPAPYLLTLSHFAEFHYGSVNPIDPTNSPF